MPTFRLILEYDGSDFHGWQWQPGVRTVEGELRAAIARVCGDVTELTAAGRTDAGAHAHGQVAGVTVGRDWEPDRLRTALNANLPTDVAVSAVRPVPAAFHARYDALQRTYRYLVVPRQLRVPMVRRYAWHVQGELDLIAMLRAARQLQGRHDFSAFGRSPRPQGSTVRTVFDVVVRRASGLGGGAEFSAVIIDVTADAFLYGMMRSIAGALVSVGQGRLSVDRLRHAIDDPQPGRLGHPVAPAHGLHQWKVTYPDPDRPGGTAVITSEQH